jgi:hypothetical protein
MITPVLMFLVYHEFADGNEGEADKYDLDMLNKDVIDRFSVNFSIVVKIASLVVIIK